MQQLFKGCKFQIFHCKLSEYKIKKSQFLKEIYSTQITSKNQITKSRIILKSLKKNEISSKTPKVVEVVVKKKADEN